MVIGLDCDMHARGEHLNQSFKTNLLGGLVWSSGCSSVRDLEKATLMIDKKSCIEQMVEHFD